VSVKRVILTLAALVVIPWAALVILLYAFRLAVCADTEMHRTTSPDGRTVAIERDEACLTKHATAAYLERGGLPRTTLVWAQVTRVQGTGLAWHGNRELWVTVLASAADAADAADDAPRKFDDVTIRYFTEDGVELRE
jgi:hypothetical protein